MVETEVNLEYYKDNEEQDAIIERGIKLLANKVLDLMSILTLHGINPDASTQYCLIKHLPWTKSLNAVCNELHAWEVEHVGQEQFATAFRLFQTQLTSIKEQPAQEQFVAKVLP